MTTIKRCTRCGIKAPHHDKLDEICMSCERNIYYPDSIMSNMADLMIERAKKRDDITELYRCMYKSLTDD